MNDAFFFTAICCGIGYFFLGIVLWFMCKDHPLWKEIYAAYFFAHAMILFSIEDAAKGKGKLSDAFVCIGDIPLVLSIACMICEAFPPLLAVWFFGIPFWLICKDLYSREREKRRQREHNAAELARELERVRKIPTPQPPLNPKHFMERLLDEFRTIRKKAKKSGVLKNEDQEEVEEMFADKVIQSIEDHLRRML